MRFKLRTLTIFLLALIAWPLASRAQGCAEFFAAPTRISSRKASAKPAKSIQGQGVNLASLDRSAGPCRDFYQFANGGWIRSHPIPDGHSSTSVIGQLRLRNQQILRRILEQDATTPSQAAPVSAARKLGDFYASCMNTQAIDAAGWKLLAPELRRIARIRSRAALALEVGRLQRMGVGAIFGFGAEPDLKNSAQIVANAYQDGLGLPSREDYLLDDAGTRGLREKYQAHVARMFGRVGHGTARARSEAKTVLRVETILARASTGPVERPAPDAAYHKMGLGRLQTLTPIFSWKRYFRGLGFAPVKTLNVSEPRFFQGFGRAWARLPLADWKIYLRWRLIHTFAPDLSAPFVWENFDFYGRTLAGEQQIEPRWQRCVSAAELQLPGPLGRQYAERALPPANRAAALDMARKLVAALRDDLKELYWMGPSTRAAAIAKLDNMTIQVGYPDRWPDDSAYRVTAASFVENVIRGNRFHSHQELSRIGQAVDRSRWLLPVSATEAFYDPNRNAIFLPAGILQPPFFDPGADDAVNYGGIGVAIGHEMTHAFDEEGSRFDAEGNLKDWWTAEDRESFQAIANCVVNQYGTYAAGGLHENGPQVLGESIADIGGLAIAYQAFEKSPEFRSRKKFQGFTPRQRFFLAYAQIWAERESPDRLRQMLRWNPHAIARYRVIGPLSDFEPFAQAFRCRGKDAMVRPLPDRCAIW